MAVNCPKCGGDMWDNRGKKKNPKAPDFKCKDKDCDGVIWPPRGAQEGTTPRATAPPARQNGGGWSDDRSNRIERQSARRDAVDFHALECSNGQTPSLDRVRQIMHTMESWLNSAGADADR